MLFDILRKLFAKNTKRTCLDPFRSHRLVFYCKYIKYFFLISRKSQPLIHMKWLVAQNRLYRWVQPPNRARVNALTMMKKLHDVMHPRSHSLSFKLYLCTKHTKQVYNVKAVIQMRLINVKQPWHMCACMYACAVHLMQKQQRAANICI